MRGPLFPKHGFSAEELLAVHRRPKLSNSSRPNGEQDSGHKKHRVEHAAFLNENGFWWLMGAVVLFVGVGVVRLEALNVRAATATAGIGDEAEKEGSVAPSETTVYRAEDCWRFIFCLVALNVAMLLWGICQEFLKTNTYEDGAGVQETVPSSLLLVVFNRLTSMVFAAVLLRLLGRPLFFSGFTLGCAPGITNAMASWCQYTSLDYISFALLSTAKSAKLLPVVVIGSIRGKRHTLLDYAEVTVIVAGLLVFGTETDAKDKPLWATEVGAVILILFLLLDSVTPHLQDYAFKRHPDVDPLQVTLSMCTAAVILSLLVMFCNGSLFVSAGFLWRHPISVLHMLVLSLSSTVSQYLMVYTVKHFGPTVLTLIVATRQMISVLLSDSFFHHHMSTLAILAVALVTSTVMIRAMRILTAPPIVDQVSAPEGRGPALADHSPSRSSSSGFAAYYKLFICAVGIHVLYCFYAVVQEFLATHTFGGQIFAYPMFVIAVNHTSGAIFALLNLRLHKIPVMAPGLWLTSLPAVADLVATYFQHKALYFIFFPAQTLLKTLKLIPVMLVGRLLKNRTYTWLDYLEGGLISALVFYFVWDFQLNQGSLEPMQHTMVTLGILMMVGYIFSDSFLSNLEDYVYQATTIDPGQMLFGLELLSGLFAWVSLLCSGSLPSAAHFLAVHKEAIFYIILQAWASAAGAYTCTLTVRLYGPAVFTLLMMSRQVFSMTFSVLIYNHTIDTVACFCLVAIAILILTSSVRRVNVQITSTETTMEQQKQSA